MRAWLGNMGLSIGGTTYRLIGEQAKRVSSCRLTFFTDRTGRELRSHGGFVKSAITMSTALGDQPEQLWQDTVLLDEDFYRALCDHPVPLNERALRAIGPRSMTIDVYVWLAYRLHSLPRETDVGWPALFAQFGAGFQRLRKFREQFTECLELALAAYPDANVSLDEHGITMRPSRPAVAKL